MIKPTWPFVLFGVLALSQLTSSISIQADEKPFDCSSLAPYCTCSVDANVNCNQFTSFKQLNFSGLNVSSISFNPKQKLVLNNDLNLQGLTVWNDASIILTNIDSFDFEASPFATLTKKFLRLFIYQTNFKFTYKGQSLEDPQVCESVLRNTNLESMFKKFDEIYLNGDTIISAALCPVILRNVNLARIDSTVQSETNNLAFLQIPADLNINSIVTSLFITGSTIKLDTRLLDVNIFHALTVIHVSATSLAPIPDDTFSKLTKLRRLYLNLKNLEDFLISSKNTWMANLNKEITIDLNNTTALDPAFVNEFTLRLSMDIQYNDYDFPEEDLCNFRYFPHNHLVFPEIFIRDSYMRCTCTLVYLFQYVRQIQPISFPLYLNNCGSNFTQVVAQCDFPGKFKICDDPSISTTRRPKTTPNQSATTTSSANSYFKFNVLFLFTVFFSIQKYFSN